MNGILAFFSAATVIILKKKVSPSVEKEHTIRLFKGLKTSSLRYNGKRVVGRVNSQYFKPHS